MCTENISIKDRVKKVVEEKLKEVFSDIREKQSIRDYGDRLNFACPFCGDSSTNLRAKRGNLYLSFKKYKCYNAGCSISSSISFFRFLKELGLLSKFDLDEIESISEVPANSFKAHKSFIRGESLLPILPSREDLKDRLRLYDVVPGNFIYEFLRNRKLLNFLEYFLMDIREERIFVLNTISNKVIGCQIRNLGSKNRPKYESRTFSKLCQELDFENKVKESFLRSVDDLSLSFGFFHASLNDSSNPVTIFEGPIDSFLFKNSVSSCGLDRIQIYDRLSYKRYWLDNDKSGKEAAMNCMKEGKSCFLWQKYFEECKKNGISVDSKTIKDCNDLHIQDALNISIADECFSKDVWDSYWL